jgi:DNA polymerase-2
VLHLYVDGLWIHKPGTNRQELEGLLQQIRDRTQLQIGLEGVYRWLAFLPSRTEPRVAVANRYFGAFDDGTLKLRGIEARRHDTCPYVKETQLRMLALLAQAQDVAEFRQTVPQAVAYVGERLSRLRSGQVPAEELVMTHRLSRQPQEYRVRTAAARTAAELQRAGVQLNPGEMLHFLHVSGPERVRAWEPIAGSASQVSYDRQVYSELLLRAVESVLAPVGVERQALRAWLLGGAGYWGPPGCLPPAGSDITQPLLDQPAVSPAHTALDRIALPTAIPLAADYKTPLAHALV